MRGGTLDQPCPFRLGRPEKVAARGGGARDWAAVGCGERAGCKLARDVKMRGIVLERRDEFEKLRRRSSERGVGSAAAGVRCCASFGLSQVGCFHAPGASRRRQPFQRPRNCATWTCAARGVASGSVARGYGKSCAAMGPAEKAGSCARCRATEPRPVVAVPTAPAAPATRRGGSLGEVRSRAGAWERVHTCGMDAVPLLSGEGPRRTTFFTEVERNSASRALK